MNECIHMACWPIVSMPLQYPISFLKFVALRAYSGEMFTCITILLVYYYARILHVVFALLPNSILDYRNGISNLVSEVVCFSP